MLLEENRDSLSFRASSNLKNLPLGEYYSVFLESSSECLRYLIADYYRSPDEVENHQIKPFEESSFGAHVHCGLREPCTPSNFRARFLGEL